MDTLAELKREKTQLLDQIAKAAQGGESSLVLAISEKLGKIESLIGRYEQLTREVIELQNRGSREETRGVTNIDRRTPMNNLVAKRETNAKSPREYGREIRDAFLTKLAREGISLQQTKGATIFKNRSGERIGIAVATERQPDRWFLGLPAGGFDHAVLLCQRDHGDTLEVRLPRAFFDQYGKRMSQSKGQLKFNVARRGSGYFVQVPGTDGIRISEFPDNFLYQA